MIERRVYIIFSQIFVKNRLEFSLLSRSLAWIYASINQDSILSSYTLVLYLDLITIYMITICCYFHTLAVLLESNSATGSLFLVECAVKFRTRLVGEEGLEPPVSLENGFTVRAATSYRLLSQI